MVFHSVLKHYEKSRKKFNNCDLPHMIISQIEHDSVKLIAENYEKEKLAGMFVVILFLPFGSSI